MRQIRVPTNYYVPSGYGCRRCEHLHGDRPECILFETDLKTVPNHTDVPLKLDECVQAYRDYKIWYEDASHE